MKTDEVLTLDQYLHAYYAVPKPLSPPTTNACHKG
jgi:hypothetical protein